MDTKKRMKCITNIIQEIDSEVELNGSLHWDNIKRIIRVNGVYDAKWDISESCDMERYVYNYVCVLKSKKRIPIYGQSMWPLLTSVKSSDDPLGTI